MKDIANHNNVSPSTVVDVLNESVTLSSFTLYKTLRTLIIIT
ncbi:LacI family DNA-binding transcriptional regulator [Lactobacillus agilis]|uniref:LacI family DNA-binding transcriptional regulator n=1 Tax=Ligilactobacillus agilis TaxID=1601 RepID=A0A848CBG5_9LACO|nr:LacI family DNA-binding transcriptional regulator [Ligilactobacillus agilis]